MIVWTLPFILASFLWLVNEVVDDQCFFWYNVRTVTHRVLILIKGMIVFAIVPSIILIVLYTRMFSAIRFDFKSRSDDKNMKRFSKIQMNIFNTCVVMVVVFLISWTYYMGAIIQAAVRKGSMASLLSDSFFLAEVLLEINSCVNPFIYAAR